MIMVINQNIEVPNVVDQSMKPDEMSDASRTALGKYREDTVTVKRIWSLAANYLTKSQYNAVVGYILGNLQGETDFWLDEFGGSATTDSIRAFVKLTDDNRVYFGYNVWHNDGHSISLKVIEK